MQLNIHVIYDIDKILNCRRSATGHVNQLIGLERCTEIGLRFWRPLKRKKLNVGKQRKEMLHLLIVY